MDFQLRFWSLSCCTVHMLLGLRSWTKSWMFSWFFKGSRIHGYIPYCKSSSSWGSKAAPQHHTNNTILSSRCEVVKCCVSFMLNAMHKIEKVTLFIRFLHRIFSQKLWETCFLANPSCVFVCFLVTCCFKLGKLTWQPLC